MASPRRNRRGLIEALRLVLVPPADPTLPGGIAGASLKHDDVRPPPRRPHASPRRNRRGLIEADPAVVAHEIEERLSPAESPGPH